MAKGPLTIPGLTPSRGGRAGGLRIPGLQAPRRENRRLPRLSIDEINARGIEAVREAGIPFKPSDRRSAFEKVLDWIDVPRAAVAQVIARVAGMTSKDIAKLRDEGTFGKQIWTSDILQHLGVKNRVARAIFGFIGDVAIDPLTYLTAGATTAKTLFKGAPKVLPGGMKALRQTTRAAVRGGLAGISDDVLKATGTTAEQIRKIGRAMLRQAKGSNKKAGKRLNRWLIRRLGTRTHGARGLEAADAARQFFVKFGERGRTILRVPFTQAKLTAKQGRRARLYKEFTEPLGRQTGDSLAKLIAAKEALKASTAAGVPSPFLIDEVNRIRFSQEAAESIRAVTRVQFGKFRPLVTPRDASLFKRAEVYINRVKASLFGGGWSPTQTEFASAAQAVGSGADAANATAVAHFTKLLDPHIERLVAKSGLTKVEVHQRMWDFIDSGNFKKLASDDPVLARMNETIRLFGFGDDAEEGKKLVEMFREFGDTHREAIDAMKRAGVAPDELFGSAPRRVTDEFRARSDPFTDQVLPELSFTDSRTRELRRINRETGAIERAYTSKTSRAAKQRNALKALDDAEWGPVQEFDISGFRHNTDQNLLTALVPPGEKGTFNQFRASIPEAAGAIAAQKTRRLAYGRIRDLVLPTSISADALANNPAAFSGFAQLRLEKFKNSPAYAVMSVLEGRAFPIQVVDQLHQFMHVASRPREINRLLRASDGLFGVWKGVTLLHPAYTLRNIVQNVIGTSMAGIRLRPMLRQSRPGSPVSKIVGDVLAGRTPTGFIVVSGQTWDARRFGDLLVQHNLIGSGIVSQISDVADTTRSFFSKITGGTLRRWFRINNQIESTMKAAAFWSALDEGTDLATALQKVARAMPDLTDLTRFEREGMKRIFPWYSWMRKNGALQLFHFLPNKPAFIAAPGKAQEAWEEAFSGNSVVPDELRPQWMREQQAVQVSGDNVSGTVFLSASWLPFQELVKLGSGLTDVRAGATALLESTRPGIRFIAETATGRDIFRRQEAEPLRPVDIPGQIPSALIGQSRTPLDTLLAIRPAREAFGRIPAVAEEQGVGAAALRGVLGGAFQPVSAERGLRDLDVRTARLMIKIRSKMNAANRKGDLQAVKRLLIQFVQLMRERVRLGLPISKASTQALSAAGLSPQEAFPGLQGAMR